MPKLSANSRNNPTHAFKSDVQLLQWTIATSSPAGVVTISNSLCTWFNSFSNTTIANTDVPADTFPVLTATLLVAAIPVPASPSGGHNIIPASKLPLQSSNAAPSFVKIPPFSPAFSTFGKISFKLQGYCFSCTNFSN